MNKIITLLLLSLLAFTFISCKDKEEEKEKPKLVKTAEITEDGIALYFLTALYDNQNRLIRVNFSNPPNGYFDFKYSTNNITFGCDGVYNDILLLDNNGYVLRDTFYTYTYENGFVKERKSNGYPETSSEYFWMNGNMLHDCLTNYEYDNRENLLNVDLMGFIYGESLSAKVPHWLNLKGFASKNYLVKSTEIYDDTLITITYEYEFDTDGYPTQIIRNDNEDYTRVIKITYY
jgi:hypothetical protein